MRIPRACAQRSFRTRLESSADAGVRARGRQRQVLLSAPVATGGERANRERAAYDEGGVTERSRAWMSRFHHVLEAPNTRRGEAKWEALIRETVGRGGRPGGPGGSPGAGELPEPRTRDGAER